MAIIPHIMHCECGLRCHVFGACLMHSHYHVNSSHFVAALMATCGYGTFGQKNRSEWSTQRLDWQP